MELPTGETAPDAGLAPAAPGLAGGGRVVPPRARPSTGDPRVDDAVARLDDLPGLPAGEHLAVFEYVHERLTEALGDAGAPATAAPGDRPAGPGTPGG